MKKGTFFVLAIVICFFVGFFIGKYVISTGSVNTVQATPMNTMNPTMPMVGTNASNYPYYGSYSGGYGMMGMGMMGMGMMGPMYGYGMNGYNDNGTWMRSMYGYGMNGYNYSGVLGMGMMGPMYGYGMNGYNYSGNLTGYGMMGPMYGYGMNGYNYSDTWMGMGMMDSMYGCGMGGTCGYSYGMYGNYPGYTNGGANSTNMTMSSMLTYNNPVILQDNTGNGNAFSEASQASAAVSPFAVVGIGALFLIFVPIGWMILQRRSRSKSISLENTDQ